MLLAGRQTHKNKAFFLWVRGGFYGFGLWEVNMLWVWIMGVTLVQLRLLDCTKHIFEGAMHHTEGRKSLLTHHSLVHPAATEMPHHLATELRLGLVKGLALLAKETLVLLVVPRHVHVLVAHLHVLLLLLLLHLHAANAALLIHLVPARHERTCCRVLVAATAATLLVHELVRREPRALGHVIGTGHHSLGHRTSPRITAERVAR
jgi:hypothetical protein